MGVDIIDKYLATVTVKDKFIGLHVDGKLNAWNITTGKLIMKQHADREEISIENKKRKE